MLCKFIDHDATMHMRRNRGLTLFSPSKPKSVQRLKKKVDTSVQTLIKEGFSDSKPTLPILFLVTHSINV